MYVIAFAVGLLVGLIYALLNVRSPAPPVVALIGLLGILIGEQIVPVAKRLMSGKSVDVAWVRSECVPHVLGPLPTARGLARPAADTKAPSEKSA
jgi:XapX domain-containing protein